MSTRSVTVFASSSPRTPECYCRVAGDLGRALVEHQVAVRNGAGESGCMGALNDAVLAAGGTVEGVNLQKFVDEGFIHPGLQDVQVVDTMRERKRLLGDGVLAFITLAGGPGTWEEFWEVLVERQIESHRKPLILVNTDGYYDGFLQQFERARSEGFLYGPPEDLVTVVEDVASTLRALAPLFDQPSGS
jgi:uncharacterized protein (TIGR00730 family)